MQEGFNALHKKFPLYAGLYLPGFKNKAELTQGFVIALKKGASGISLFGNITEEVLLSLKEASVLYKSK